jgi:hypothetical protein
MNIIMPAFFLVTSSFEPTPVVAPWMRVRISKIN